MARNTEDVGRVVALNIYPVKSMGGESVPQAKLGWQGLAHDRRFAFQRLDDDSGLPWLSARDFPDLLRYKARIVASGGEGDVLVDTPSGNLLPVTSDALLRELAERSHRLIRLTQLWRGTYDAAPLSLIANASVSAVEAMVGRALEIERFRANIVVETLDGRPFGEDRWIGESLIVGDSPNAPRLRVNRKDLRCRILNLSPATAEEDVDVLSEVVRQRKNNVGVYASPEFSGVIARGDVVRVLKH